MSSRNPTTALVFIKLEHTMRVEAKKLKDLKDSRMNEVLLMRKQNEALYPKFAFPVNLSDSLKSGSI